MYSSIPNKNKNKPNPHPVKKQRPKPQWTTDFIDREQYKLTEVQKIQKKASLQSKNRQQAKRELEERRKKLEMGIIDQQTRKIYETALLSKNIDINPPLRRNLTQMIRYQKQQKQKTAEDENQNGFDNQEELDEVEESVRQLKEAQNFIKKFQKAKKQQKIQRAVEILKNNKSLQKDRKVKQKQAQPKINNFFCNSSQHDSRAEKSSGYHPKVSGRSQSLSQDEALSSIEDTIRFMEEKLFAAKKTVDEHSKSFISEVDESFENQKMTGYKLEQKQKVIEKKVAFKKTSKQKNEVEINFNTKEKFRSNEQLSFGDRIGQISQLRINLRDQDADLSDDQGLDTIRRMRQLMDNGEEEHQACYTRKGKQNLKDNFTPSVGSLGFNSTISKRSYNSALDSEAQVSFNLTVNNDDEYQQQNSFFSINKSKFKPSEQVFKKKPSACTDNQKKDQILLSSKTKQQQYEEQYQKIKQNLFSCINSNFQQQDNQKSKQKTTQIKKPSFSKCNQDSDEEEDSDVSLMVRDKIDVWKKQMEHQIDPDEENQEQTTLFKTTAFTKNAYMPSKTIVRQQLQYQQQDQEQEDDSPYRYNYLSEQRNQNKNSLNRNNQQYRQYETKQSGSQSYSCQRAVMKKPPLNKGSNKEKFQEMKRMISNASSEIEKIQIQPLKIQPLGGGGSVLGFDFRGSINIKKNILSK